MLPHLFGTWVFVFVLTVVTQKRYATECRQPRRHMHASKPERSRGISADISGYVCGPPWCDQLRCMLS
eukprot:4907658-Pyramimonas_sp.AAC.1